MTLWHTSLGLLSSGILILESRPLSLLRLPIFSLGQRGILCGLSLISTPSLLRDVCFCLLLFRVRLLVFLIFFLRSLNEVHRSSTIAHALIHPIFIHRILLFLDLVDFPTSEPAHVIAPISDTFLRQRVAHLRVGSTHFRGKSSGAVPPPPSSTGVDTVEAFGGGGADVDVPPSTTSDDSDIRHTLDHVLTVQATHGQILVDVLNEIHALRAEFVQFRRSLLPPPFDDGF